MISTAYVREMDVSVYDADTRHSGKEYIHADNRVILMKFDKAMLYEPIWEPTQWELENLYHVMLNSVHLWESASINVAL